MREDGKAPHFIKVDWDKWVDEDEDSGTNSCLNFVLFVLLKELV